jgi:hypothetical protein
MAIRKNIQQLNLSLFENTLAIPLEKVSAAIMLLE